MEGQRAGGAEGSWLRHFRGPAVVCVLVAAALLGLERADTGAPLNAVPVAAKVKPTTTTSSTSSTSSTSTTSTSTTSTTIKHCDDGTGIDNPQNKHCRPPSPHS